MTQTLIRHRDIQNWVAAHKGQPAIARVRNSRGELRSKLSLRFGPNTAAPTHIPSQDDGVSPCSWSAWLAELDRQELALQVSEGQRADFTLVERKPALH